MLKVEKIKWKHKHEHLVFYLRRQQRDEKIEEAKRQLAEMTKALHEAPFWWGGGEEATEQRDDGHRYIHESFTPLYHVPAESRTLNTHFKADFYAF